MEKKHSQLQTDTQKKIKFFKDKYEVRSERIPSFLLLIGIKLVYVKDYLKSLDWL